jgi:2-polyprenyl-3-methyl-5-hydroxy-6-metoxy-1,4-benzoquinol methylase
MKISDDEWFELQFQQAAALEKYGIEIPAVPSDDIQLGFTGQTGRSNMQQAFSFYQHLRSTCRLEEVVKPSVMDFGGGWGRIARLFLRETTADRICVVDTMKQSIDLLRATGNRSRVIHNQPRPPIIGLTEEFDIIYAYSVFSHLSEEYFAAWIGYLLTLVRPGGYLAFTTRGDSFINHLDRLHKDSSNIPDTLVEHVRRLRDEMSPPEEIRRRYRAGEFQFFPIGGTAELTPDFFGEAFIPKQYVERKFGAFLLDFDENVPNVDQSVVVLRKPPL